MTATRFLEHAPRPVRRWVLHFETKIEDAVAAFAAGLPAEARVLDAGAGEGRYRKAFAGQHYLGVDLAVGDRSWNYLRLDAVADLNALPFHTEAFDAALNIVTLEHLEQPDLALREIARVLKPGGQLLLATPLEWEEHQQPHDFFRYTQFGLRMLLEKAGFDDLQIRPAGGYFRLMSRRLLNGLQFFMGGPRWILFVPAAIVSLPVAMLLPLLEPLDVKRNFTLGYLCSARKLHSTLLETAS